MPRRTSGELVPLEQYDVFPSHRGQVIRSGGADNAAADDDDAGVRGEGGRIGHGQIPIVMNPDVRIALTRGQGYSQHCCSQSLDAGASRFLLSWRLRDYVDTASARMADHLDAQGVPNFRMRPNALFALSLIDKPEVAAHNGAGVAAFHPRQ